MVRREHCFQTTTKISLRCVVLNMILSLFSPRIHQNQNRVREGKEQRENVSPRISPKSFYWFDYIHVRFVLCDVTVMSSQNPFTNQCNRCDRTKIIVFLVLIIWWTKISSKYDISNLVRLKNKFKWIPPLRSLT